MPINLIAAIVVGISNMVLGFIWYGPLFATKWVKETGLGDKDTQGSGLSYGLTFVSSIVMGAATSLIVHLTNTTELTNGLILGLVLGLGFVATTYATTYIFSKKTTALYLIDAGYQVVAIMLAGLIATLIR